MGVLNCARGDCPNVMCDRLSHKYGYICDDCFEELVEAGLNVNIKEFMNSDKKDKIEPSNYYDYFNEIFPFT